MSSPSGTLYRETLVVFHRWQVAQARRRRRWLWMSAPLLLQTVGLFALVALATLPPRASGPALSEPALAASAVMAQPLKTEPTPPTVTAPAVATPLPEPGVVEPPPPEPVCGSGRACNPMVISTLPFATTGDTRDAVDDRIDQYSCAPDIDESGGEIWYQVTVAEVGWLRAAITEDPADGVDVDLHLLSAKRGDACIKRGNARFDAAVEPGVYWIVVDTCAESRGEPLPGTYALTVDLLPAQ